MLIKDIKLSHFMSIEHLELDLSSHTYTIITGDNASGKSSLIEAVSMALLERRKGDAYKDYVQTGHKKATIDMNVVLQGKKLRIVVEIFTRKYGVPVQRTIYLENEIYKNSDCTKLLKTFNVKYLQHITFAHQKEGNILDLRPSEVSSLLKELFEINYSSQAQILSEKLTVLEENEISLRSKLEALQSFVGNLKQTILLPSPHQEIQQVSQILQEKETFLQEYQASVSEWKSAIDLEKNLKQIQNEYQILLKRKTTSQQEIPAIIEKLDDLQKSLEQVRVIESKNIEDTLLKQLEESLKKLSLKLKENEQQQPEYKSQITVLQKELQAYQNGVCPVCKHDLSQEFDKITSLQQQIQQHEQQLQTIQQNIQQCSNKHKEVEQQLLQATSQFNSELAEKKQAQLTKAHLLKEQSTLQQNLHLKKSLIKELKGQLDSLSKREEELSQKLETMFNIKNQIPEIQKLVDEIDLLKGRLKELERIRAINEERQINNASIQKMKEEKNQEIVKIKEEISLLLKKAISYKEALTILLTEFPNYVILQRTSQLENSINKIIQRVFPKMTVKLILKRSGISFYYSPNGNEEFLPAKMSSGAQSAVLMLAWRISLAEMYGIDTLILDEIDADANDTNSRIIYELLGSLTTFTQVILISHRKSSIQTVQDLNDSTQSFWVENGIYHRNVF